MDKEMIALIIAQNGLGTAATILAVKAAKLKKKLEKAKTPEETKQIESSITKTEKLSAALRIANDGIIQYQAETSA